jgi:quaternary ammonium compound-resistance protein SugE
MAWVLLFLAGLFEVGWAVGLKYTEGFTRFWPSATTVVSMAISLYVLGVSLRSLPLGTAYAVWTGIGAAGTVIVQIIWFKDPATAGRLVFLTLLIGSVIGLKLVSPAKTEDPAPVAKV